MDTFKYIKDILAKEGKVGENQYKQRVFLKFFEELGYGYNEIRFEDHVKGLIYDSPKFVDITCGDILLEVKSSDQPINKNALKQAFNYNQAIGVNIIGVTNFKKFKFYDKSVNNPILEFDINNYKDDLDDIYRILGKHTFSNEQTYFQYHERMNKLNGLLKNLKEYLEAYKSCNYETLPFTEKDNQIFSTITRNLHQIKYFNANLDSNLEQIINKLSYTCEVLDNLMAIIYQTYSYEDGTIFRFNEIWLRNNVPEKINKVQEIKSYVQKIEMLQQQITQLDNVINYWNNHIYDLSVYYERQAEMY